MDTGVRHPAAPERLVVTPEPDDEAFLAAMPSVAEGTLDVQTRESETAHGPRATAREALEFCLERPGKGEWWRLAPTRDGALVGLASPAAAPYRRNAGCLGVVPEMRGQNVTGHAPPESPHSHR